VTSTDPLPPSDRDDRSPITGLTRAHWSGAADRMLLSLRPYATADRSGFRLPGRTSRYGERSDSLEAFARSFMLAAFRLKGEDGTDAHGLADWYADGLVAGTDPTSSTRWPRPDELDQAKVEAASIALGLHLTRPWIWDRLPDAQRASIVDWLESVVGGRYPPINWVWFQVVVETFLCSVGARWSAEDVESGLAVHESLYRGDGWYADGSERAYDHYVGWALHFYPLVWADMAGPQLCPATRRRAYAARLRRFLDDAVALVGADGAPLLQGRSLIYRFAAAAPLWVGAATGESDLDAGLIRRACSGMLRHFASQGAPDDRGLLTLGLRHAWPRMAQDYSGFGSPYWAAKGFYGLSLPETHSVWTAVEQPLPLERADTSRVIAAPGWLVSGTKADGIVRVVNHGTDHSTPGDDRTDSPLYARLGYSTATIPPLVGATLDSPSDNSVGVLDGAGNVSHRNGFVALGASMSNGVAIGVSRARAHWVDASADTSPDHGSGRPGVVTSGPWITTASAVHGPTEARAVRVDPSDRGASDERELTLEVSGWPLAGGLEEWPHREVDVVHVRSGSLLSQVVPLSEPEQWSGGVREERGTSPLGELTLVPVLSRQLLSEEAGVHVVAVTLCGSRADPVPREGLPSIVEVSTGPVGDVVRIAWPDGTLAELSLPSL
jgi:hypothetical protein